MNPLSVDSLASLNKPNQPRDGANRTFFKAALLVSALLGGGLATLPADASLQIITTGTIVSGSETGGLFGLPVTATSLTGNYTLVVHFDNLGPNYFTTGDGMFADDIESTPGTTGYVTAIVNGHSLTTPITDSLGSALIEDLFDFNASNAGFNGGPTGDFVNVQQGLACSSPCVPYADLMQHFTYALGAGDFGMDSYIFQAAGFPAPGAPTANFTGTEATFAFVPEPASWILLATGLLGLGIPVRRRYS